MVAVGMVEMSVGVHDNPHRKRGQPAKVGDDLACLRVGRASIDHERGIVAEDDADVLVEEHVATHEDAIAELDPVVHPRNGSGRGAGRGVDKLLSTH